MYNKEDYLLFNRATIEQALEKLNNLDQNKILFILDENEKLLGSLTDGDIRRGLLKGFTLNDCVVEVINKDFKYSLSENCIQTKLFKEIGINLIPILDEKQKLINIYNINNPQFNLPINVLIMAGGEGKRLRPLTENIPKPLLKVGHKPILSYNLDRFINLGIKHFSISVNYLANKIVSFVNENYKNISIDILHEDKPLGTIAALKNIKNNNNNYTLITNSDILTDLDYLEFYNSFISTDADILIATVPYNISVPYAILELENEHVLSLKEKPTFTYYANAGIYLIKNSLIDLIPENKFFNATDLIDQALSEKYKVVSFPILSYWLDIGSHSDFQNAQKDILHLKL